MVRIATRFALGLAGALVLGAPENALAKNLGGGHAGRLVAASISALPHGPDDVYANIPERDEFGRDQLAMFREWNSDPVGHHEANLRAINPLLAEVVRKAQADNPGLRFVVGSGLRGREQQEMAVKWGWSRTLDSPHRSGNAVDLWPLDAQGHVVFAPAVQSRISMAMKVAAAQLKVSIFWGGHFDGFKDKDRSHFELAPR
jgi:peptidoglycan LD-endopeptidase CwlK